jgi:hypothetical protein
VRGEEGRERGYLIVGHDERRGEADDMAMSWFRQQAKISEAETDLPSIFRIMSVINHNRVHETFTTDLRNGIVSHGTTQREREHMPSSQLESSIPPTLGGRFSPSAQIFLQGSHRSRLSETPKPRHRPKGCRRR